MAALSGSGAATTEAGDDQAQTFGVQKFRPAAKRVYDERRWRRGPGNRSVLRNMKQHAVTPEAERRMRGFQRQQAGQLARYRTYRRIARHAGPTGHGPLRPGDERWWVLPAYIVCGESTYNFHVNDDGAYQIIDSTWSAYGGHQFAGQPTNASPLEQHIMAHRVRFGGNGQPGQGTGGWYGAC